MVNSSRIIKLSYSKRTNAPARKHKVKQQKYFKNELKIVGIFQEGNKNIQQLICIYFP